MSVNCSFLFALKQPYKLFLFIAFFCAVSIGYLGCAPKSNVAPDHLPDSKKEPTGDEYAHTILAQMAFLKGDIEKAKDHVYQGLLKDPDSAYLNLFMSSILKEKGEIDEAVLYAKRAVNINSQYTDAYVQLGDLYMLKKEEEKAAEYYQNAFKLDPSNEKVASILLGILMKANKPEEAIIVLNRLIEKRPDLPLARYYKAKVLMDMDKLEEAEPILVDLIESDAGIPNVYNDLLNIYEYKGRYQEAKELLSQMLQENQNDFRLRERYINLCIKTKDYAAIEEQLKYLKQNATKSPNSKKLLGSIYIQTKRYKEAIDVFNDLLNEDPSDDRLRFLLGLSYEGIGDREKALEVFLSFAEESEFYNNAIFEASRLLATQKKYSQAIKVLQDNSNRLNRDPQFYVLLSFITEKKEGIDAAKKVIKTGLEKLEGNEELLYRLGILYDKANQKSKAIEIMRKILEKNKDHADALNYIGYTYADEGRNLKEALQMIKRALRLKPGSGYIIDSLGWVYFRLGDLEKAQRYLLQALELEPHDPTIHEHVAELYERLGQKQKALRHYKKSLELGHSEPNRILKAIQRLKGR